MHCIFCTFRFTFYAFMTSQAILSKLDEIMDPELGISIVKLGLIYHVSEENGEVNVLMTLTTPACPLGDIIEAQIRNKLEALRGVKKVNIELTFDPPWSMERIPEDVRLQLGIFLNK